MISRVDKDILQQLLVTASKDGIQKIVVGAVIKRDKKFLLLERVALDFLGGLIELPSGAVDQGEDLLSALGREVREETGLELTSAQSYLGSFDYLSGSGKRARQFNFLVETNLAEIKLNPQEHRAFKFVSLDNPGFSNLNISEATREILRKA